MNMQVLSAIYKVSGPEFSIRIRIRIKWSRLFEEYAVLPVGIVIWFNTGVKVNRLFNKYAGFVRHLRSYRYRVEY